MQKYIKLLVWTFIIFYICLSPSEEIPKTKIFEIPYFDKIVHFGIYFVFSLIFTIILESKKKNHQNIYIFNVSMTILFGGLIEILQHYLPIERSADFYDFMADLFGTIAAVVIYLNTKLLKWTNKII